MFDNIIMNGKNGHHFIKKKKPIFKKQILPFLSLELCGWSLLQPLLDVRNLPGSLHEVRKLRSGLQALKHIYLLRMRSYLGIVNLPPWGSVWKPSRPAGGSEVQPKLDNFQQRTDLLSSPEPSLDWPEYRPLSTAD